MSMELFMDDHKLMYAQVEIGNIFITISSVAYVGVFCFFVFKKGSSYGRPENLFIQKFTSYEMN